MGHPRIFWFVHKPSLESPTRAREIESRSWERLKTSHIILIVVNKKGVSENRGAEYSTLNNRILIIRTPK